MLKLAGLNEVGCVETDGQYEIEVTVTGDAPKCGCLLPNVRKNGRKKSMFNDTPIHGKRVGIWVQRQRYQCTNCHRTLYETVPHMSDNHDMTERLVKYIQKNGTERTFTALAGEIGLDVQTVRRIWKLHAQKELDRLTPVTPEWMGIDELHIMHGYRAVITNVKEKTIVDMLENRKLDTIIRYLAGLDDPKKVKLVTIDMHENYRTAVNMVLPHALIVVDRFHISRMAGEAMDRVRKQVAEKLTDAEKLTLKGDRWLFMKNAAKLDATGIIYLESNLGRFPRIKAAWEAKEGFRAIWKSKTRQEAEAAYDQWLTTIDPSVAGAFEDLIGAMTNWRNEVFNYFEIRITNAYTEGMNAVARVVDRFGRGYSFKVLRAKILLKHSCHKQAPPPRLFSRGTNRDKEIMRRLELKAKTVDHDLGPDALNRHLGVNISTLAKWLESLPPKS